MLLKFKQVIMKRVTQPVETVCLFLPLVAFFLPMDQFFFFGSIACLMILLNVKEFKKIFFFRRNYLLYVFILYMSALALVNKNVLGLIAAFFLLLVVLYVTYLRTKMTHEIFETMMVMIGFGSMFSIYYCTINFYTTSTYKLYEFFMKYIHLSFNYVTDFAKDINISSTFINMNIYGHISAVIALISVYYILLSLKKISQRNWIYLIKLFFYLVILAVNLYALHITHSRSSAIGFAVGLAVVVFVFDARLFIVLSIPTVLMFIFNFNFMIALFARRDTFVFDLEYRLRIYLASIKEIIKHPFIGKGFYTFPLIYQNYGMAYEVHTHNIFIELLLDAGLVGLPLIAFYYSTYIQRPFDQWVKKHHEVMPLVIGVLALEIVNGLTDAVLIFPQSFILLSVVLLSLEIDK